MKKNIADYFLPAAINKNNNNVKKNVMFKSPPGKLDVRNGRSEDIGATKEPCSDSSATSSASRISTKAHHVNKKMEDLEVNSIEEKSFPIPFHKFLELTNILDLVDDEIKRARSHSYDEFINNMAYVQKLARRCYLNFYMNPKCRKKAPLKNLTMSDECPEELKMRLMEIPEKYQRVKTKKVKTPKDTTKELEDDLVNPKPSTSKSCQQSTIPTVNSSTDSLNLEALTASSNYQPPSFKVFKKFVNFEEEVKQRMKTMSGAEVDAEMNKSMLRNKFELEFYKEFYASPTLRHQFNWKLRPCPRKIREQILTHSPLQAEVVLPESSRETDNLLSTHKDKNDLTNDQEQQKEAHHFQYPISFELFKKYTYQNQIVDEIFKATSEDNDEVFEQLKHNETQRDVTFKNYYEAFYRTPDIREKFKIKLKPCPSKIKNLVLQIPAGADKTETLKIPGNLTSSNKRSCSPSKTLVFPQAKKQKTKDTIDLPTQTPTLSKSNEQLTSINEIPKNVQVKTVSALHYRLLTDYVAKKTANFSEAKRLFILNSIKERFINNVDSTKANAESALESNADDLPLKRPSQKTRERALEMLSSPHDSDDTDINSEVERTPGRYIPVRTQKEITPRKDCTTNFKQNADATMNKNKNQTEQKETQNKAVDEKAASVGANLMNKMSETESNEKALSPKSAVACPARVQILNEVITPAPTAKSMSESKKHDIPTKKNKRKKRMSQEIHDRFMETSLSSHDSDETDVNSELERTTVRNVHVRPREKQVLHKECTSKIEQNLTINKSKSQKETAVIIEAKVVSQKEAASVSKHYAQVDENAGEKNATKRNETLHSKDKAMLLNANLATAQDSDETDVNSELETPTVKNFQQRSKEKQPSSMNCSTTNLNRSGADNRNELKTEDMVKELKEGLIESQKEAASSDIFFRKVDKSHTLAYAVRRSRGLKRLILLAILKMTIDEFSKYTRIHEHPKIYDDTTVLKKMYDFVFITEQTWPPILYMTLTDTLEYLMSKGIELKNLDLQLISPKLLHFEELAIITNFDEIVHLDYFKETAKKLVDSQLKERRLIYYKKCWAYDEWIWRVPIVYENWQLLVKHKETDTVARLLTPPLDKISTNTEGIEMVDVLNIEKNSTPSNRAADAIKSQDTANEHSIESSWGVVSTEDDVETVIFPIFRKESRSASQKSFKSHENSVKDLQDKQAKENTINEEYKSIKTSNNNEASTPVPTAAAEVTQNSITLNSTAAGCSQNLKSIPELTQKPGKIYGSNQVQSNVAQHLPQATTNKTLLPLSPNIFITSSGSTTSQNRSQHHSTQSSTTTINVSNISLTVSTCISSLTEVSDFFVNMPNTQNQIESLPMDEMLCSDPLYDDTLLKEPLEANTVKDLTTNSDECEENQADKKAALKVSEEQSDKTMSRHVNLVPVDKTSAASTINHTESIPTEILEPASNAAAFSSKEPQVSSSHSNDVDKEVNELTETQMQVVDQSASNSQHDEVHNCISNESSITTKETASLPSAFQPNESVISVTRAVLDDSSKVPLSVKREIVDQNIQFGLQHNVQNEDNNVTTVVIDDSDDEAGCHRSTNKANTDVDIKVEPKFLSHLQFSLDDSNSSVHVHTLQDTPAILIDDDCDANEDVNETASNLIDQLMNPTEQTTFPSLPLSGISSSLSTDAAKSFSEAQKLPSSLEESGSAQQTPQSEPNQEIQNSNDTSNCSEDIELLLEINVENIDDLGDLDDSIEDEQCETKSKEEDQQAQSENIAPTLSDVQTMNLPTEANKKSTHIVENKHKKAVVTKSNRQTENKNSHLVPQLTHAFRSLPVTVVKAKPNENPTTTAINTAPPNSKNCTSATDANTINSASTSLKPVDAASTTKSFSASQALANDCTLFDNSQLLRDLATVQGSNIEANAAAAGGAELKAMSSTSSLASTASATSSYAQQVPSSSK